MIYVFDTSSLIVMGHMYPTRFPSLWRDINILIEEERFISVREVYNELEQYSGSSIIQDWAKKNRGIFHSPNESEQNFVKEIFSVDHFRYLLNEEKILKGTPVADPFVIAAANAKDGFVVTQERLKGGGAKIPNVCQYFGVRCTNLEGFMKRERLQY